MPVQKVQIDPKTSEIMDTLRGVSALVVACVHAYQVFLIPYFGLGSPSHVITGLLATHAVTTFFVASGFMICISVFRHRDSDGSFQSRAFAEARILRIYPPLIAALLLTISVYFVITGLGLHGAESYRLGGEVDVVRERVTFEWDSLPSTFFLLYGTFPNAPAPIGMDGPLWTLGFEWWFYVLAFVFARLWNGLTLSTIVPFAAGVWIVLTNHDAFFIWFLVIWLGGRAVQDLPPRPCPASPGGHRNRCSRRPQISDHRSAGPLRIAARQENLGLRRIVDRSRNRVGDPRSKGLADTVVDHRAVRLLLYALRHSLPAGAVGLQPAASIHAWTWLAVHGVLRGRNGCADRGDCRVAGAGRGEQRRYPARDLQNVWSAAGRRCKPSH
jgi:hypothetical protein